MTDDLPRLCSCIDQPTIYTLKLMQACAHGEHQYRLAHNANDAALHWNAYVYFCWQLAVTGGYCSCVLPNVHLCQTCMARRSATPAASLMTPSPKTKLKRMGLRSLSSTCSTATESVVAKIAPRANMSCRLAQTDITRCTGL